MRRALRLQDPLKLDCELDSALVALTLDLIIPPKPPSVHASQPGARAPVDDGVLVVRLELTWV